MTLVFCIPKYHFSIKSTIVANFWTKIFKILYEILCLNLHLSRFDLAVKSENQLKIIISIIMEVLDYPMPHTKYQGYQSIGSTDEDFFIFFLLYTVI